MTTLLGDYPPQIKLDIPGLYLLNRTCAVQNILTQFDQFRVLIKESDLLLFDGIPAWFGAENEICKRLGNILGGMRGGVIVDELILMRFIERIQAFIINSAVISILKRIHFFPFIVDARPEAVVKSIDV